MLGLLDVRNELEEIYSRARHESELLVQIQAVEAFWKANSLQVVHYKETRDLVLGNNEDLMQKVDDHLLTVINLIGNRFVEPIRGRVEF